MSEPIRKKSGSVYSWELVETYIRDYVLAVFKVLLYVPFLSSAGRETNSVRMAMMTMTARISFGLSLFVLS